MEVLVIRNKTISTPLYDIIKFIQRDLKGSKLKKIKAPNNGNIQITCPFHNDGQESNPSSAVYIGESTDKVHYGDFHCFTCDEVCSFSEFVAKCYDISIKDAEDWLLENYSDGDVEQVIKITETIEPPKRHEYLDESILKTFESFHPYMIKRKLSKEVISQFEIKYDSKCKCLVFPVRDERGRLVMLTRRSVIDKTFIIDAKKEKPVYLLYDLKRNNAREAYVCESQINALTLRSYGYPGVATFGCNVTPKQFDIFKKSGLKVLHLMFDGDAAGDHGIEKFIENISDDILVDVIRLPRGKDVNDLTKEEVDYIIQNNPYARGESGELIV